MAAISQNLPAGTKICLLCNKTPLLHQPLISVSLYISWRQFLRIFMKKYHNRKYNNNIPVLTKIYNMLLFIAFTLK